MLDYARLVPGRGFQPMRAALYYSQRAVTNGSLRNAISKLIAAGINYRHPLEYDPLETLAVGPYARLRDDGCVALESLLNPIQLKEIEDYLEDKEMLTPDRQPFTLDQRLDQFTTAFYPLATILGCPHLLETANSREIVTIASAYLGCKPTISSIGLRWFFPSDRRGTDIQHFHRDPDDWRFLKLFIYLTDVTANTGPHRYVHGTHRGKGDMHARTYLSSEIEERFGTDRIEVFTGPRGTTFIADTRGIHSGGVPSVAPRLMFQVQYSLLPVYAFRYEPQRLDRALTVDDYLNRLIVSGGSADAIMASPAPEISRAK